MLSITSTFDGVDHEILIKKWKKYGMCSKNLLWIKSYLSNWKQYIDYKDDFNEQKSTDLLQLQCRLPQGSTVEPLVF